MIKTAVLQHQTTLYTYLVAVVMILFYRYTGQEDITIGVPVSGRNHIMLEKQIGFYVNTLVLRQLIKGGRSFCDTLECVKKTVAGAFSNREYPFDLLVDELNIKRDTSMSPLFNIMVVLHRTRIHHLDLAGIKSHNAMPDINTITTSKFDITFHFHETDGKLGLIIEYNTDLFRKTRILRLVDHIKELVKSIHKHPARSVDTLNFIPAVEKKELLCFSENMDAGYPAGDTLVSLFEKQTERSPEKTALVFHDQTLTYEGLNKKANCLAYLLRSRGIKRESIVALLIERSPDMVIAVLGCLKAGAAYLPIDIDFPLEFWTESFPVPLEDIGKVVILTPELCHGMIYFTCHFVPNGFWVSVIPHWRIDSLPDIPLGT